MCHMDSFSASQGFIQCDVGIHPVHHRDMTSVHEICSVKLFFCNSLINPVKFILFLVFSYVN